jgi:hypothetical protein
MVERIFRSGLRWSFSELTKAISLRDFDVGRSIGKARCRVATARNAMAVCGGKRKRKKDIGGNGATYPFQKPSGYLT